MQKFTIIMNNSLTSSAKELENTFGKVDEKDPKQLLRIIAALISKSKTIIETLDATVARLEKTEKERNYWKNGYLRFRDACQKYIDADGSNNFRHLVELQEELRKLEAEKLMLQEDSRVLAHYNRSEEREDGFLSTKRQWKRTLERSENPKTKRKQNIHKSISTVSFTREGGHSEHHIAPKKVFISRVREKERDQFGVLD